MRMAPILLVLLAAGPLAGCRTPDPACGNRTAVDFTPTARQHAAMSPVERRAAQARLDDMARRCGWEP